MSRRSSSADRTLKKAGTEEEEAEECVCLVYRKDRDGNYRFGVGVRKLSMDAKRRFSLPAEGAAKPRKEPTTNFWDKLKNGSVNNEKRRARTVGDEISKRAVKEIGNSRWSKSSNYRGLQGQNKSHIFIAEILEESGAVVPHIWPRFLKWSPIEAYEWCNSGSTVLTEHSDWTRVTSVRMGDVVACEGLVGLVTNLSPGMTTSAASGRVVQTDWGFRAGQKAVYWRYTGTFKS